MNLYLSPGATVPVNEIVAIMDIEKSSTSKDTREYLALAGRHKRVISLSKDLPKSFVVSIDSDLTETVYICGVSAETLRKRLKNLSHIV